MGRHLLASRVSSVTSIGVFLFCVLLVSASPRRPSQPQPREEDRDQQGQGQEIELEDEQDTERPHAEELRRTVLKGLGLRREPDVSKMNVSQEEYSRMYNVYLRAVEENARKHEQHTSGVPAPVQRLYTFTHTHPSDGLEEDEPTRLLHQQRERRSASPDQTSSSTWLYFPVDIPESRRQQVTVEHATLRLFVSADDTREEAAVHVRVYQVLADFPGEEERVLLGTQLVHMHASSSKWTDIDVTKAVQAWSTASLQESANTDTTNLGLELECRDCERNGITLVTGETSGSNSSVGPALNLLASVHLGSDSRAKRSAGGDLLNVQDSQKEVCHKDGQKCCTHVMQVNFKQTPGLEYIIQPKEFDAGYCKGRCPPRYNPAHHHAVLQTLLRKQKSQSGEKIPRVCCAPSRLRELEVLHLDEEDNTKLKLTVWDNMQVLECACS